MSRKPIGKRTKKVFYIITEGKTEESYISEFTQKYRCSAVKIKKIKPCGAQIIHRASEVWKHDKNKGLNPELKGGVIDKDNRLNLISKGIVIDKDRLTEEEFNSIKEEAKSKGIGVFFSNSAFEVWLLAHFEPITKAVLSSAELKEKLSRYLSQEYKKGDAKQLRKIAAHFNQAIKNTKNVCEVSYHTQCTNVGQLCLSLREDT
ncbi:RloB family protein [Veillonella sp. VA137]|uniref:RloB family protein n=1 Tax=Veillonella sp. VA137 TaxID=741828 RepID=UPI000F8C8532|nr:RloB family protein [Veillonella sp. VA137]